jgi:hypothetical protein
MRISQRKCLPFTGNTLTLTQLGVEMVILYKRLELTCYACSREEEVFTQKEKWDRYMNGALVQDVWGKSSPAFREMMIGGRTNMWLCEQCWETELTSD